MSVVSTAAAGILAVVALGFAYLAFLWIRAQIVRGTSQRTRRKRRSGPLERARDSARWETEVTAMGIGEAEERPGERRSGRGIYHGLRAMELLCATFCAAAVVVGVVVRRGSVRIETTADADLPTGRRDLHVDVD